MASSASAYMATSLRSRASSSSSVSSCHRSRRAVTASSAPSGSGRGDATKRVRVSTSSAGSEPSRKTLRTEKSSDAASDGAGGSTTAPPRGTCTSNSRSAQFTARSWCGAARCSTTRWRRPAGSKRDSGRRPLSSGVIASCTTTLTAQLPRTASRSRRRISLSSAGRRLTSLKRRPVAASTSQETSAASGQNTVAGDGHRCCHGPSASAASTHSCPPSTETGSDRRARTVTFPSTRHRASNADSAESSTVSGPSWSSMVPASFSCCRRRRTTSWASGPGWRPRASHTVGGVGRAVREIGMSPSGGGGTCVASIAVRPRLRSSGGRASPPGLRRRASSAIVGRSTERADPTARHGVTHAPRPHRAHRPGHRLLPGHRRGDRRGSRPRRGPRRRQRT